MTYDRVVYETANKKCQISEGTLAMPKTKDINDFLLQEMKKLNTDQPMWIGMNDKEEEGTIVWEDGSKVNSWGNVYSSFLFSGDCYALNPTDGKWHDYGCSNTGFFVFTGNSKLPFICQYRIKDDSLGDVNGDDNDDGSLGKGGQGNIGDVGKLDQGFDDDVVKDDKNITGDDDDGLFFLNSL